jgi:nifR3 family TIM-barrel protein
MRIGALHLETPLLLAPLAGVTNLPFRLVAREAGCAMVFTEMVSAEGLARRCAHTLPYLRSLPAERPLSVQLFGADPAAMAEAAALVQASGADAVDINFGCAVRKVTRTGAGVALMRTAATAEALLTAVRSAVRLPLTIKLRSGWDGSGRQALEIGSMAEACGVDAVILHPRTAGQKFSGRADWALIAALKQRLQIPVIGNGDVCSAEDARRMMAETGCDAVMIGRKAIGYPRIFTEAAALLAGRAAAPDLATERLRVMQRYAELTCACYETTAARALLRCRLGWFAKGMRGGAALRQALAGAQSVAQALELAESHCRAVEVAGDAAGTPPAVT